VYVREDGAAGRRVGARARREEEVLPGEARRGAGHLVAEGVREIDLAAAGFLVAGRVVQAPEGAAQGFE
jgi:hypothetical protein